MHCQAVKVLHTWRQKSSCLPFYHWESKPVAMKQHDKIQYIMSCKQQNLRHWFVLSSTIWIILCVCVYMCISVSKDLICMCTQTLEVLTVTPDGMMTWYLLLYVHGRHLENSKEDSPSVDSENMVNFVCTVAPQWGWRKRKVVRRLVCNVSVHERVRQWAIYVLHSLFSFWSHWQFQEGQIILGSCLKPDSCWCDALNSLRQNSLLSPLNMYQVMC